MAEESRPKIPTLQRKVVSLFLTLAIRKLVFQDLYFETMVYNSYGRSQNSVSIVSFSEYANLTAVGRF